MRRIHTDKNLFLIIVVLIVICAVPLLSRTDVYTNSGRWFYESSVMSSGHIPYRDFTWQYPPLGIVTTGSFLALFGSSTISLYAVTLLIAFGIAVSVYKICRLHGLESKTSILWTAAFFGASNLGVSKTLGSIGVFTPTWPIGLAGLLLTILGVSNLVTGNRNSGRLLIVAGVTVSLLTKQEFAFATFILFALMVVFRLVSKRSDTNQDFRHEAIIFAVIGSVIAASVYGLITLFVGSANLLEGLSGYGQSISRTSSLIENFPATHLPIVKEALRSVAGTTAIIVVLLLGLDRYRSNRSVYPWLNMIYLSSVVFAISLPGELLERNYTIEAIAIYSLGLVLLISTTTGWRALFRRDSIGSKSIRKLILLVVSVVLYEALTSIENSHEILLMAPLRISPWVPLLATVGFVAHYLRNSKIKIERNEDNHRYWLLFTLCALAAGMQIRFVTGLGSAPEYSLAMLASLMLLYNFSIDNFPPIFGKFRLPAGYQHIPLALVIGVLAPTVLFLGIGKPAMQYIQHRQMLVSTASGPLLIRENHAPVIQTVIQVVEKTTADGSPVISMSYAPWVNFVTSRPGMLPVTQLQILSYSDRHKAESLASLKESPPVLIIEDLVNDNGTKIGLWSTNSHSKNPWLWSYIDSNYVYCQTYAQSEPRAGLWGVRFYVQREPSGSAPDCPTFKKTSGLNS